MSKNTNAYTHSTHKQNVYGLLLRGSCHAFSTQESSDLKIAEVNHAIHHLAHAEAVPEVMERVAAVIFLNSKLENYGS